MKFYQLVECDPSLVSHQPFVVVGEDITGLAQSPSNKVDFSLHDINGSAHAFNLRQLLANTNPIPTTTAPAVAPAPVEGSAPVHVPTPSLELPVNQSPANQLPTPVEVVPVVVLPVTNKKGGKGAKKS